MKMVLTNTEKGFLAGIIEGEGAVFMTKKKCLSMKQRFQLIPTIDVTNTDKNLINYVNFLTTKIRNKKDEHSKTRVEFVQRSNWSPKWKYGLRVRVNDNNTIIDIINEILPILISKKRKAKFLLKYCKSRLIGFGKKPHPYNKQELEIYDEVKKMNKRGRQ